MFNPVTDPPTKLTGIILFLLGVIFFPLTFYSSQKFLKQHRLGQWICRHYNLSTFAIYDISNKFTSSIFAFLACSCGLFVLTGCMSSTFNAPLPTSEEYPTEYPSNTRYYILDNYLIFGVSYFFYDCFTMFIVFSHEHSSQVIFSKQRIQRFFSEKTLIILHHIFVPLIGFPALMISRGGYGDCLLGTAFLVEASTPFVSLRVVLCHLGLKKSKVYILNGVIMLASFFFFRVCIFPALYLWYVRSEGLSKLIGLPIWIHCAVMGLWAPQLLWFHKMIKGTIKLLSAKSAHNDLHQN
eukprot:TRINITY_DN13623_c0_g1_i1.p1 TRINITY_DN13623_c0_g1~~TRINITY_DN13623_c0_g1_i1.p1  ORF type:complete len:296 (+),score=9.37 TRINITY_DN13623_c0_g1_i1:93-980(+)